MSASITKRLSSLWLPWRLAIRPGTLDFILDRRGRQRFLSVLFQYAIDHVGRDPIPSVEIEDLAPRPGEVVLANLDRRDGTMSVLELYSLARLAREAAPRRIFEIGTLTGNTTLQLAVNTPADCEIVTLDLDPRLNAALREPPYRDRVHSIKADSTRFDFSPFHATCDLVLVDGSHEYEDVKRDSAAALRLLGPGGVAVWHDYGFWWEGVVRSLRELARETPLVRIRGTSLVVHRSRRAG